MKTATITSLYEKLRDSPSGHTYTATQVPGREGVYLGVDAAGRPCLFVEAAELMTGAPLRTSQVSLRLNAAYELALMDSGPTRALFHSLCCESSSKPDIDTFLVLVEAFVSQDDERLVDGDSLIAFFRSMVRLFSVKPARDLDGERQGLWGELFLMSRVRGFEFWAPFWHSEPMRRFDFSSSGRRVEVKTTIGAARIHHFSHRQIYAQKGEEIVIASLLLREEDAGLSLRELIEQAREVLRGSEHFAKLERAVREAGMESMVESGPIYDAQDAEQSLACFRSTDAPHFRVPEPPGVSETRYKVDLSTAPPIDSGELEEWLSVWSVPASELAGVWREQ